MVSDPCDVKKFVTSALHVISGKTISAAEASSSAPKLLELVERLKEC